MLLVLTHSEDCTTDAVLAHLQDLEVFRFNIDLWRDYRWEVDAGTFILEDPLGRVCREENVHAVYLRKLFFNPPFIDVPAGGSEENWLRGEILEFWEGLRDLAMETGKLALVHPAPTGRWNKLRQMRAAARWFRVPGWNAFHRPHTALSGQVVVKSFGQRSMGNGSHLMVRRVESNHLSPEYPWFTQALVEDASHDVTVVYVSGKLFAYQLTRDSFEGDDCRFPTTLEGLRWETCELTATEQKSIHSFMRHAGYTYGRLDFLRDATGLWFLEVNPNGQFAWLDPEGDNGLLIAVADAIRELHRANSPVAVQSPRISLVTR